MRVLWIAGCWAVLAAPAQTILPPARIARLRPQFTKQPEDKPLACGVRAFKPELDLAFRFGTGYSVSVPLKQFQGPHRQLAMLVRVTPLPDGQPVYLGSRVFLPPLPKTNEVMQSGGGFLVGEGRYRVDWMMHDDQDRVCRHSWTLNAELKGSQRAIKAAIPAGSVAEISGRGLPPASNIRDQGAPFRLTVMLQAAPVSPRRATLQPRDRVMLLGTLSTMLNRMPVSWVRLVVFNLDQQRELYRRDDFHLSQISEVSQSINQLNLQKVDFAVLRNRTGDKDFLTALMDGEAESADPSDVVVFLGPYAREAKSAPDPNPAAASLPFFYFQMRSPFIETPPFPDLVAKAVGRVKGKVIVVKYPADFAAAIAQVERAVAGAVRETGRTLGR